MGGIYDWLTADQSDAQVFGIILVGLLRLRDHGLGWETAVGLQRAVVISQLRGNKIVVVFFIFRVVPPGRGDGTFQAASSVPRFRGDTSTGKAPIPLQHLRCTPSQQGTVLLVG